ncbi:MAG: protease complex subunit PrcB family protein [Mesonia hippocampi]|uniref:protease complex subunit PrcB family protein n=1 Tax=Mesonia hippocampi TaxID=1628250 RepID=UPI003F9888BF
MKKILIIACLSVGLMACSSDDANEFEPTTLEINTIAHSEITYDGLAGAGQEGILQENKVISTVLDWQGLIDDIDYLEGGNEPILTVLQNVSVDFQQEEILAVFDEVKTTGGYSIDIVNVVEHEKKVVVTIDRLKKGGDATVITQPFHIVKIPKLNKPVAFVAAN